MKSSLALVLPVFGLALANAQAPDGGTEQQANAPTIEQMQREMQSMRQQMDRMHGTENADEHRRLMREHMQSMSRGMMMMGQMMGGPMGQGQMGQGQMDQGHMGQGQASECSQDDAQCQMNQMQMQQRMMGQRMGMMQQMMEQMMQHMSLQESGADADDNAKH